MGFLGRCGRMDHVIGRHFRCFDSGSRIDFAAHDIGACCLLVAVSALVFSPDGQYVLTGSGDDSAKLWDLSGQEVQSFEGHQDDVGTRVFAASQEADHPR